METLRDHLGLWRYERKGKTKWYYLTPTIGSDSYTIMFGTGDLNPTDMMNSITVTPEEAVRRIRSKARGGFRLVEAFIGTIPGSADLRIDQVLIKKKKAVEVEKPKKKYTFWDWLSGEDPPVLDTDINEES